MSVILCWLNVSADVRGSYGLDLNAFVSDNYILTIFFIITMPIIIDVTCRNGMNDIKQYVICRAISVVLYSERAAESQH